MQAKACYGTIMSWFLWQKKLVIVCYQLLTLPLEYLIQGWVVLDYEIKFMCLLTTAYNYWTFEPIKKLGGQRFGPPLPESKVTSYLLLTEKLVWNVPSMCLFHSQNSGESMTKLFWAMDLKSSNREFKWCSDWHLDSFQVPCSTPLLHLYMAKCLLPNLLSSFEVVVTLRWFQRSLGKLVL